MAQKNKMLLVLLFLLHDGFEHVAMATAEVHERGTTMSPNYIRNEGERKLIVPWLIASKKSFVQYSS